MRHVWSRAITCPAGFRVGQLEESACEGGSGSTVGPGLQALLGVVVVIPGVLPAVLPQGIGRLREALFRRLPAWSLAVAVVGVIGSWPFWLS